MATFGATPAGPRLLVAAAPAAGCFLPLLAAPRDQLLLRRVCRCRRVSGWRSRRWELQFAGGAPDAVAGTARTHAAHAHLQCLEHAAQPNRLAPWMQACKLHLCPSPGESTAKKHLLRTRQQDGTTECRPEQPG